MQLKVFTAEAQLVDRISLLVSKALCIGLLILRFLVHGYRYLWNCINMSGAANVIKSV